MKKILILTTMFVALATISFGQVSGTPHGFAGATWNPGASGTTEICAPCHQPHGGTTTAATQVLFSQTLSSAGFTLYDSPTVTAGGNASGSSLLCLSCHDDATDMHATSGGGTISGEGYEATNPGVAIGTDLSGSHPIGVDIVVGGDFQTAAAVLAGGGAQYIGGKVECASCHDPHVQLAVELNFLITSNVSSALCLDCHIK